MAPEIFLCSATFAADKPDARDLLKQARAAQSNVDAKFTGHFRIGASSKKTPFILSISNGVVRYEFQDNKDTITLRTAYTQPGDHRFSATAGTTDALGIGAQPADPVAIVNGGIVVAGHNQFGSRRADGGA